jgi:hypothetical protein
MTFGHVLLIIAAVPAVPAGDASACRVTWSEHVGLGALTEIDQELAKPWASEYEVEIEKRARKMTVRNCRDFLMAAKGNFDIGPEDDWVHIWLDGMRCFALELLRGAQPARSSLVRDFKLVSNGVDLLPPQLGLSVSNDANEAAGLAASRCTSLKRFERRLKSTLRSSTEISLHGEIWDGFIRYLARADFDGDGFEDLMLMRFGAMRSGSYGRATLFVLTRTPKDRCLRVVKMIH